MAFLIREAEHMRREPTKAEAALWAALKPLGFVQQLAVRVPRLKSARNDYFILDFFHLGRKLCVEVDGSSHRRRKGRDGRRDRRLAAHGIRTLRVSNEDVLGDLDATLVLIRYAHNGG